MRASLNEIKQIDAFITGKLPAESSLLIEANQLINPQLKMKIFWQRKVHEVLRLYHQKKIKQELNSMHDKIFNEPQNSNFKRNILTLFNL